MKLPQLSLRDLFWLVLVCALATAFWLERERDRQRLAQVQEELGDWASELGAREAVLSIRQADAEASAEVREQLFLKRLRDIQGESNVSPFQLLLISPGHEQTLSSEHPPQ